MTTDREADEQRRQDAWEAIRQINKLSPDDLQSEIEHIEKKRQEIIQPLFAELPEDHDHVSSNMKLCSIRSTFQSELATAFQPAVDGWISQFNRVHPAPTPDEMDTFAADLTEYLNRLGLAIKSPNSPDPSRLSVIPIQRRGGMVVKFTLESLRKGPRTRDPKFDHAPAIELIDNPPLVRLPPPKILESRYGDKGIGR